MPELNAPYLITFRFDNGSVVYEQWETMPLSSTLFVMGTEEQPKAGSLIRSVERVCKGKVVQVEIAAR